MIVFIIGPAAMHLASPLATLGSTFWFHGISKKHGCLTVCIAVVMLLMSAFNTMF